MRVALFTTCLVDAPFPEVGKATVRLLERLGHDVEFPREQTCCGQMHANSGYFEIEPDRSAAMLADKMQAVIQTEAEVLCAGDSSCLMHIGGGLSRNRAGVRTLHLAEILASTDTTQRHAPGLEARTAEWRSPGALPGAREGRVDGIG